MGDRDTMARLLAGETLTPTEAAVFGAEFVRARWSWLDETGPNRRRADNLALCGACNVVDAMNAALANARSGAPVAPVAEPAPDREVARLRAVLSRLIDWTNQYGRNLCPGTVDTYGEGVRACKSQVASMISAALAAEPAPAEDAPAEPAEVRVRQWPAMLMDRAGGDRG